MREADASGAPPRGGRAPRLVETLRGFAGVGGPRWLLSVLRDRTPVQPEDLTPEDFGAADCATVTVAGRPVLYRSRGSSGPPIVFIHGFGERLQIWEPVQDDLARDHRTVALDLWGFGAAARPTDITPRDWVAEVSGLLEALRLPPAVLVGHSLGGRVALMCARYRPECVQGLVLCDADWGQAPHGYLLAWLLCRLPLLEPLLGRLRSNPEHLRRLIGTFGTPSFQLDEAGLEALRRPLRLQGTVRSWRALGSAPPLRDVRGLLQSVRCPATVVHGADDPIVPLWAGEVLAQRLEAPLHTLPRCGHFSPEEYPREVTRAIRESLPRLLAAEVGGRP